MVVTAIRARVTSSPAYGTNATSSLFRRGAAVRFAGSGCGAAVVLLASRLRVGVFLRVALGFRLAAIVVAIAGLEERRLALPDLKTNKLSCFFLSGDALQSIATN